MTPRIPLQDSLHVCLLLLIALGNLAAGQPPRDRNAVVRRPQPFDAKGRVYSVSRGLIHMLTDTQQPWFVQVDRRTQIQVHGEGGTELISPGVFVRFEAALIGRRVAAGEIAELALFNPAEGFRAGVMADPGPTDEKQLDLGSKPQEQAAPPPGNRSRGTSGRGRKQPSDQPQGHYLIAGQVRSFRKGNLVVLAGKAGTIKAKVAPQAKVTIDMSSYSMVRRGDTIHVTGSYARPGQVRATKVEIELASREQPADRGGRKRGRPGRKPAEALNDGPQRNVPTERPDRASQN